MVLSFSGNSIGFPCFCALRRLLSRRRGQDQLHVVPFEHKHQALGCVGSWRLRVRCGTHRCPRRLAPNAQSTSLESSRIDTVQTVCLPTRFMKWNPLCLVSMHLTFMQSTCHNSMLSQGPFLWYTVRERKRPCCALPYVFTQAITYHELPTVLLTIRHQVLILKRS